MSEYKPYGEDTLVIPFTWSGSASAAPRIARMTRLRPRGQLYGRNIVNPDGSEPNHTSPVAASTSNEGHAGTAPVFVVLPNGQLPVDASGHPIHIASPMSDLSGVAAAGRAAGASLAAGLQSDLPLAPGGDDGIALLTFFAQAGMDVGTGGRFDFQRSGGQLLGLIFGFQHLNQFVSVSNFSVGLWLEQAGYSLDETLRISGRYAKMFSNQKTDRTSYGLTDDQQKFMTVGWQTGATGVYGAPSRLP